MISLALTLLALATTLTIMLIGTRRKKPHGFILIWSILGGAGVPLMFLNDMFVILPVISTAQMLLSRQKDKPVLEEIVNKVPFLVSFFALNNNAYLANHSQAIFAALQRLTEAEILPRSEEFRAIVLSYATGFQDAIDEVTNNNLKQELHKLFSAQTEDIYNSAVSSIISSITVKQGQRRMLLLIIMSILGLMLNMGLFIGGLILDRL